LHPAAALHILAAAACALALLASLAALTPAEKAAVRNQGTAVAVPEDLHASASPTYKGRTRLRKYRLMQPILRPRQPVIPKRWLAITRLI